jgi:predicted transcriptional regulator
VSEEPSVAELLAVLDDEYARPILVAANAEPQSAKALAAACDASLPTVYRRLDTLAEYDLITERTELDDDGHHYSTYEATLQSVTIELDTDGFNADVSREPTDAADRFTELWEEL